ncbi:MAG TPA: FHA domain-containing protein [Leptospiraceae bacterium]|nr:FHA domain-containing protein [Leptospiraceae bacterium]HMW07435.1 FHA domain-containing protein [Leptospiraceae bacterium]HMY33014.1 FHA domain-containing protein [Leptospiraceae bacterium]HNE09705.1 FHA domain-containing protein [Leptospiraceae bacterium]HNF56601.1 FHA domain-containing protein [Leptospiraceae bacterium]
MFKIKLLLVKLFKRNILYIESGTSMIPLKILKRKTYLIGRGVDPTKEIPVNSMELSRVHATIEKKKLDYYLIDNFSKNGTFLNGEKLAPGIPYILIHNDNIEMGDVTIKYLRE